MDLEKPLKSTSAVDSSPGRELGEAGSGGGAAGGAAGARGVGGDGGVSAASTSGEEDVVGGKRERVDREEWRRPKRDRKRRTQAISQKVGGGAAEQMRAGAAAGPCKPTSVA